MRFGLFGGAVAKRGDETADSQGYRKFIDLVVEAESLGFHSIFLVEHHFSGSGQVSSSLNLLSYLAARTSAIRLGTAVTVLPWHNPVLIAEQAATVDLLSGGRLDFGVGKGYRDIEFEGFCIPKEEGLPRYEESVDLIRKSWLSDDRFDHDGRFWSFRNIVVEPPVVQKPHPPLWSAAGTDESIARVAKSGFNILLDHFATDARTRERLKVWQDTCAEIGRPLLGDELAVARGLAITRTEEEYEEAIQARVARSAKMAQDYGALPGLRRDAQPETFAVQDMSNPDGALIGTPERIIERLQRLQSWGVEYVLILLPGSVETLREFSHEIMPAFETQADAAQ